MNTAKVELHLHLDGSLNIMWAYKKAIEREVVDKNTSFEEFYNLLFSNNGSHSAQSIKKFDLVCDLLQYKEDLFDATYDLARRLDNLGLIYAEIRLATQHHTKKGLSQLEALEAVKDGAIKAMEDFDIKIGIINCLMHKQESAKANYDENMETIEATKQLLGDVVLALDLAGFENNCNYKDYDIYFEKVREYNIPFTMHAGEMGDGSHILDAIEMGAHRIGHGVNCIQDERYVEALLEKNMPLEVCVSSNVKTDRNYGSHPVRYMLEKGLKVTLNSDNMIFSRTDLVNEHNQLRMLGVDDETLMKCTYNAIDAAFCDEKTKKLLLERLQ